MLFAAQAAQVLADANMAVVPVRTARRTELKFCRLREADYCPRAYRKRKRGDFRRPPLVQVQRRFTRAE